MMKYWALDYVDDYECELVVDDQLYASEEEAEAARAQKSDPEHYEVNWYTLNDLKDDVFACEFFIDDDLHINTSKWQL